MRHPDQLERLRTDFTLIPTAIEEILRYDSPLHRMWRRACVDVELGGQLIRRGQIVLPAIGAANRDPAIFSNPNELNISRDPNPHLSFGYGVHLCIGADLARIQGAVAVGALVRRLPNLQLASNQLRWTKNLLHRGLLALPVRT